MANKLVVVAWWNHHLCFIVIHRQHWVL